MVYVPFFVLLSFSLFVAAADLYKILDSEGPDVQVLYCALIELRCPVHKSSSEKDIRAAYKRLSKKFHPDKNKEPDAESRFVEIARGG